MHADQAHPLTGAAVRPAAFVFVITYGRSGSTLLQSLLNGIDGYCVRGENGGALFHLSRAYHALQDAAPLSGMRESSTVSAVDHPWFGGERMDIDGFARSMCDSFVDSVLSLPESTRVGGFKEIRYHVLGDYLDRHLDFIARFFPNAKFIFNRRNLDSVASSGWWKEQDAEEVIQKLSAADKRFEAYAERNSASCIMMDYDQYSNAPNALEPLYQFLGEPFDYDRAAGILGKKLTHLQGKGSPKS